MIDIKYWMNYHKGQTDRAGVPYIKHIEFVADGVKSLGDDYYHAGLLHDIIEDTEVTADMLIAGGVSSAVVEAVALLTRTADVDDDTYYEKIKNNEIARAVKISDLKHNSDLSRLKKINEKDLIRNEKYKKAISFLSK